MIRPSHLTGIFSALILMLCVHASIAGSAIWDLYVTASDGTILEYTPTGTGRTFAQGLDAQGRGLTFDNAGNLLVATTSFGDFGTGRGTVLRIDCTGLSATRLGTVPGNDVFLEGLARNSAGDVFVAAQDNLSPFASTIFKFNAGGGTSTVFGTTPGGAFGLAFDAAGNLFAADAAEHTIYKFAPDGTRTVFASDIGGTPIDLTFDVAGDLFVSIAGFVGQNNGYILEFPVSGSAMTFASGLDYPRGLAFDMMGNLYVSELAVGDILRFAPDGNPTVFASGINGPQFLAFGPPSCRSVPEGGTTGALFGIALIGLAFIRRIVPG
jgi:sugar lactone lactonase YvrE